MNLFVGQLSGNNQRDANMYMQGCNELLIKRLLYTIHLYVSTYLKSAKASTINLPLKVLNVLQEKVTAKGSKTMTGAVRLVPCKQTRVTLHSAHSPARAISLISNLHTRNCRTTHNWKPFIKHVLTFSTAVGIS